MVVVLLRGHRVVSGVARSELGTASELGVSVIAKGVICKKRTWSWKTLSGKTGKCSCKWSWKVSGVGITKELQV